MRISNSRLTRTLIGAALLVGCGGDDSAPLDGAFDTVIDTGPDATTSTAEATFTFHATTTPVTFRCSVDDATPTACTSPFTTTVTEGAHTFEVAAVDEAQTIDRTPATRTWTLDQTGPDTTITSGPPAADSSLTTMFEFTSDDDAATFECSLDDAAFAACTSPTAITVTDGPHQMTVRAIDAVGNVDASPAVASWSADAVAPVVTITSAPTGTTTSASSDIAFTVDDALATTLCQIDDGAFVACTSPFTTGNLADGNHLVTIRATDEVNHVGEASAAFTVRLGLFDCGGFGAAGLEHTFAGGGFFDANRITLDGTRVFVAAGNNLFTLNHALTVTAGPTALPGFGNIGLNYDAVTDSLFAYTVASATASMARLSTSGAVLVGPVSFPGITTGSGFVDALGHINVLDRTNNAFRELDASLGLVQSWGAGTLATSDVEFDARTGKAWALGQNSNVSSFAFGDPARPSVDAFTLPGTNYTALTIDDNGTLYGTLRGTNQIVAFTQAGVVLETLQLAAGSDPASMTFDPVTRRLLVSFANGGNGIVRQLCPRDA